MRTFIAIVLSMAACKAANNDHAPDAATTLSAPDGSIDGAPVGSSSALVIAFEAPLSADTQHFTSFVSGVLPHISGIGGVVQWSTLDACGAAPCATEPDFKWAALDTQLMAYVTNATTPFANGCAGGRACKIALFVSPTNDSGDDNDYTPKYVFSQTYATSLGAPLQDVAVCNTIQGGTAGWPSAPPVVGTFAGKDYATWNANAGLVVSGTDLSFPAGAFPTTNFSGYPVIYEAPFTAAYQHFIASLLVHYSPAGSGDGPTIASYLGYVRFGFHGGEDDPGCSADGQLPSTPWSQHATTGAGDLVQPVAGNAGGFYYVANSAGTTGATAPTWCQTVDCNTAADGGVAGWRNTGLAHPTTGSAANAMWPSPTGQPNGMSDANYIGWVHSMYAFLAAQHSAVPLDISSHNGPPFNGNWAYADSAAIAAVSNGIGFGNEGVEILDPMWLQMNAVPSSHHDWVENFGVLGQAPVIRHLQTLWPGSGGVQAETFTLNQIVVASGTATATCSNGDCSIYCTEGPIQITGSTTALNATWPGTTLGCTTGTVTFAVTGVADGTYAGGQIWAPDYLPITMPFATGHGANAIELHECSLDYAYGVEVVGARAKSCTGSLGPDASYQAVIATAVQ